MCVDRAAPEGEDEADLADENSRTQDNAAMSRGGNAAASNHVVQRWCLAADESASSAPSKQVQPLACLLPSCPVKSVRDFLCTVFVVMFLYESNN